jgi:hypothetical protein
MGMSLLRPIHWYHSRADLIWPVGPFNHCFLKLVTSTILYCEVIDSSYLRTLSIRLNYIKPYFLPLL